MGFLLHFGFFLLIKNVLSCMDDQCRILAFPSTLFFVGERLVNHTIENISVIDRDMCEYRCYLNHNCVSINFYFGPIDAGAQNCELNNSTNNEHVNDLMKAENYVYHGTRNPCGRAPCVNNAICQSGFTHKRYRCICSDGFTGSQCEQDIDECAKKTHECDANAECHNTVGSFVCKCKPGYEENGQICVEILGCEQNPCYNEGACIQQSNGYNCTCLQGFTGAHCETDIDDCASSPCSNKGTCVDQINKYRCSCATGFSGINCEIDIDECAQNTHTCSLTGGVCRNSPGSFMCSCKPGFIGDGHTCQGYIKNSNILSKNESYLAHLREFLVPAVGNDANWWLCYRASLHGWTGEKFHTACDGKKNTLTVIQKDQYVFGGYTDVPWGCPLGARTKDPSGRCCVFPFKYRGRSYDSCIRKLSIKLWCSFDADYNDDWDYCDDDPYIGYRRTDKAFIYSLENKEVLMPFKSMVKDGSQAIYMDISYGPTFGGGHDIYIANNAGQNSHSYARLGQTFLAPSEVKDKNTVLAGSYNFNPDEVEVFYHP